MAPFMFILRDILLPLQDHFYVTNLGRERASLFVYILLSIIVVPFTSSMTSNVWRCLDTLFRFEVKQTLLHLHGLFNYAVVGAVKTVWGLIPSPETEGRILVALDDSISTKVGKKIFGCKTVFDHAAK